MLVGWLDMWLLGGPLGFCVLLCILCSRSVRTLRSRCATPCRLGALACANQNFLEITCNFLEISWNFLEIRIGALVRSRMHQSGFPGNAMRFPGNYVKTQKPSGPPSSHMSCELTGT